MKHILTFPLCFLISSCAIQTADPADAAEGFYPYYYEVTPSQCRDLDACKFIENTLRATTKFQLNIVCALSELGTNEIKIRTFETNKESIVKVTDLAWDRNYKKPHAKEFTMLLFFGIKKNVDRCIIYAIQTADCLAVGYSGGVKQFQAYKIDDKTERSVAAEQLEFHSIYYFMPMSRIVNEAEGLNGMMQWKTLAEHILTNTTQYQTSKTSNFFKDQDLENSFSLLDQETGKPYTVYVPTLRMVKPGTFEGFAYSCHKNPLAEQMLPDVYDIHKIQFTYDDLDLTQDTASVKRCNSILPYQNLEYDKAYEVDSELFRTLNALTDAIIEKYDNFGAQ